MNLKSRNINTLKILLIMVLNLVQVILLVPLALMFSVFTVALAGVTYNGVSALLLEIYNIWL